MKLRKTETFAFHWKSRDVEALRCCFHTSDSSPHWAVCQGRLFHCCGREIQAVTTFEQQDSGGNERAEEQLTSVIGLLASSLAAWLTYLWSIPGTFAHKTKTQQIMLMRNFLNFYQLLTDKVFNCLGRPTLKWVDRRARSLEGAVIFIKPDGIKKEMQVFGVSNGNIDNVLSAFNVCCHQNQSATGWMPLIHTNECWLMADRSRYATVRHA